MEPTATRDRLPHQMALRLDDTLITRLRDDAAENGRTVAQSIRHYLRQALDIAA